QYYVLIPLLFGTIISCTEQENSQPEDHSIHHPFGGEIIYRSTTCRISWNTPSWSSVDIELNSGSDLSWQICEALPNTGSYNWNIPIEIPDGSAYSVRVSNSENPQSGPAHTGSFEIRSRGEISTLTDNRDGQTYRTVKIGSQWWMAENFNLIIAGASHCYNDIDSNSLTHGRFYTLEAAIENCPAGWHLPTDNEWKQLETYLGIRPEELDKFGERGVFTGLLLGKDGGTGFDALYGGYHNGCVGKDAHRYWESHFWTATKDREGKQMIRVITNSSGSVYRLGTICHGGSSVRYIKDSE
ncbi:MAG: hypothetical protein KAT31_11975, partial [Bacteroidales bacterium]|nr:hypothetical protein [Bacteroidales bacterium]